MVQYLCSLLFVGFVIMAYGRTPYEEEMLRCQVLEDYERSLRGGWIDECDEGRMWTFQQQTYFLTDKGQWECVGSGRGSSNFNDYLTDLANRKTCPRGHSGVYLDCSIYPQGLWCCLGRMSDGSKCFFHFDNQYPKGIPKSNGVVA